MTGTPHAVMLALGFAGLVLLVTALARRLPVPVPILQVGAGLLIGVWYQGSAPHLDPDLVFFVFLPPVLWSAAYFTSLREFRENLRPIGLLAIGLVLATTGIVAVAAHALLPGLPWAAAVALGAIVSPPDAAAAEAILKRLPVPRKVLVILEGESLVNDASALVLYRTAVAAAAFGHFSMGEAVVRFFIDALLGVLVGLAVAWLVVAIARRSSDAIALSLLALISPYVAWLAAEFLHVSAVLACVAGGLHVRQYFSSVISPLVRLQNRAVWDVLLFVMNALIFVMLGVQFGSLVSTTATPALVHTGWVALVVSAIVIAVRLIWVPLGTFLPRWLSASIRAREPEPDPRSVGLIAWTSMRGIVSLASVLALPVVLQNGRPWPYRSEMLLITMGVILATLVLQGLTLEPLVRRLRYAPDPAPPIEARHARREAIRNGLDRLADLADEPWVAADQVEQIRIEYQRRSELDVGFSAEREQDDGRRRLRAELLQAERRAVVRLRDEGAIGDEVLLALEWELDVEALRIGAGSVR